MNLDQKVAWEKLNKQASEIKKEYTLTNTKKILIKNFEEDVKGYFEKYGEKYSPLISPKIT